MAKLVAPVVLGTYQEEDTLEDGLHKRPQDKRGLYMYPRVVALWLHLHVMIHSRCRRGGGHDMREDWRDPLSSQMFGRVNELGAQAFTKRVVSARNKLDPEEQKIAKSHLEWMDSIWRQVRRQLAKSRSAWTLTEHAMHSVVNLAVKAMISAAPLLERAVPDEDPS